MRKRLTSTAVIAQTSLAEILLKLNTGLVTVINAFLSRDEPNAKLDCQSLTALSERSREETCYALRQLYRRMLQQMSTPTALRNWDDRRTKEDNQSTPTVAGRARDKRPLASPKRTKVKGPMLARVIIAGSKKPSAMAMVRPGERKKKRKSLSEASSKTQSCNSLALPSSAATPLPLYGPRDPPVKPLHHRASTQPERTRPQHKQSALDVSTIRERPTRDVLRATRSTPHLDSTIFQRPEPPPPMPSTAPLPDIMELQSRRRLQKPTPTYYSVASDSTKLGEIPLHKWSEPFNFDAMSMINKEAARNGWPVTDLVTAEQKKKRGGLFGIFRRIRSAA